MCYETGHFYLLTTAETEPGKKTPTAVFSGLLRPPDAGRYAC